MNHDNILAHLKVCFDCLDPFPITILERFFGFSKVKTAWGIVTDSDRFKLTADWSSFVNAYTTLLKLIKNGVPQEHLDKQDKKVKKIDTRVTEVNVDEILVDLLPKVEINSTENKSYIISVGGVAEENSPNNSNIKTPVVDNVNDNQASADDKNKGEKDTPTARPELKQDPYRRKLVFGAYVLNTDNARLYDLFLELKKIPIKSYPNIASSGIRIFLDLAIYDYIQAEKLEAPICAHYKKKMESITLKDRLEYLKSNKFNTSTHNKESKIINRLLDSNTTYPLDILNGYMHSMNTHYLDRQYLNGFWDFLFPLLETLLDIQEVN